VAQSCDLVVGRVDNDKNTERSRTLALRRNLPLTNDDRNIYLFVPTRWFGAISIVSVMDSWRTARPRSAMAHVPFFFTRIFLDLRSR